MIRRRMKEDQETRKNVLQTVKIDTSRNVFQRNYEASKEVEDRKAKTPRWVDIRPPQQSYANGDVRIREKIVNPVTKKNLAPLGRKWYVVGKDGKPITEMRASMIRKVQRQHKAHMNSLKVLIAS
ncbi:hypothetical protein D8674_018982 [Pyrus ussuriensis x Pyrus communis]|uniref:Uncharacterized protein n=1 Tax=Pyrus ussuriensis x Pyrus communis TaxID=2448454 RepID=A0A5N5GBQ2_9ROSA|nr:hypothetical protein D8674_018982 [Pyrus ussuriensis x Pyrus communis]